jgi:hypothetical protein
MFLKYTYIKYGYYPYVIYQPPKSNWFVIKGLFNVIFRRQFLRQFQKNDQPYAV